MNVDMIENYDKVQNKYFLQQPRPRKCLVVKSHFTKRLLTKLNIYQKITL